MSPRWTVSLTKVAAVVPAWQPWQPCTFWHHHVVQPRSSGEVRLFVSFSPVGRTQHPPEGKPPITEKSILTNS